MNQRFTPRPYQSIAMDFITSLPRCALWAGMGMGKTSTCLTVLETAYNVVGDTHPTLVLAPKRVALSTWPGETKKWDHLRNLEVTPVIGTMAERWAAVRKDTPVHTINYDNLPWLVEHWGKRWPYRRVVADEATRLKNFRLRGGGARATALATVAHQLCDQFIELTGTPSPNGLVDLWGQLWFLDEGKRLGKTYTSFQERWFRPLKSADGYYNWVPFDHSQDQIMARIKDLCLTIDPKDWFDLKDPIVTVVEVDLEPKARALYKEFERELYIELTDGSTVEAVAAAQKSMKCLQLASGAVFVNGTREWKEISTAKMEALESIVNESGGMPILVSYHFVPDLERLKKHFPQGRELDDDPQTIVDWNAGKIPMLFAHPQSAGHGLNLQDGGNIIVYYSNWWDLEGHDQILERIGPVRQLQAGHDRNVFVYYLVAKGTVDELVLARHKTKRGVQDLLLEYMKGTK